MVLPTPRHSFWRAIPVTHLLQLDQGESPGRLPCPVKWLQLDRWVGITVPHPLGLLVDRDALCDGGIASLSVALP